MPGNTLAGIETSPSLCIDLRNDCQLLITKIHCDSIFSSALMTTNCALSCNRCENGPTTTTNNLGVQINNGFHELISGGNRLPCQDQMTWCPRWASSGMCNFYIFQPYMQEKCTASCGLC